jgi:succinate dehydrogenase flavin-adding protein (antitoxin of CptAB toxin-antitoxin module)
MKTIDREGDFLDLINELDNIIDNFMGATYSKLSDIEAAEQQDKLQQVLTFLREQG